MTQRIAMTLATVGIVMSAAGGGCAAEPVYEAEPVGTDERCFAIERSSPNEAELGTACLVDPTTGQPLEEVED